MACRTKSHSTELARAKSATRLAGLRAARQRVGHSARAAVAEQAERIVLLDDDPPAVKLSGLFPGIVEGAMVGLAQLAE